MGYGAMISDQVRMQAYAEALKGAVFPGAVVVDIGSGPGIFSMLACQYGARKVYAIEPDDSIQVGKDLAVANGLTDRIEFIQNISTRIELPEQADVIVSDLRSSLPLFQSHLPAIIDARNRFLKPDGRLIPQQDSLWAAVIENPGRYRRLSSPWLHNRFGLDLRAGHKLVSNTILAGLARPKQFLAPPLSWGVLDYPTITASDVHAYLEFEISRSGMGHGILTWFDTWLAEGIGFSNAPGKKELVYGRWFFPWPEPVKLAEGDLVTIDLNADLVGMEYIWRWNTRVNFRSDPERIKAHFKQSTLWGAPFSLEKLHRFDASSLPELDLEGRLQLFALTRMDGQNSLADIAAAICSEFPQQYSTKKEALAFVADLAKKFSR